MFKFVIRIFFNSCLWLFVYKLLFIVDFAVTHTYKHTMIIWYDLGGIVCTVNIKDFITDLISLVLSDCVPYKQLSDESVNYV